MPRARQAREKSLSPQPTDPTGCPRAAKSEVFAFCDARSHILQPFSSEGLLPTPSTLVYQRSFAGSAQQEMQALRQLRQLGQHGRAMSTVTPLKATLFPGDGVGPEICDAVSLMLKTAGVPVEWDVQLAAKDKPDPRTNSFITRENLDSVKVGGSWTSDPRALCPPHSSDALSLRSTTKSD